MRRILIPIGGKSTNSKGAATFDLGLEKTGDWRNIKVSLQIAGPAEWGLFSGGAPLTFGRGRRVTLGPELLEPQDQVQVQVTNGPASQPILGAVSGLGGTMEEIVGGFNPAPNTIALDAIPLQSEIGTITTTGTGLPTSQTFPVPAGTLGIQFITYNTPFALPATVSIVGDVTGDAYLFDNLPALAIGADMARWIPPDANAICSVIDAGTPAKVTFVALGFSPTFNVRNGGGVPLTVVASSSPPAWQAPNLAPILINTTVLAGGNVVILAAVAGQQVRIFSCSIGIDAAVAGAILLQDTTGANYHGFETSGPLIPNPLVGLSAPLPVGVGVRLQNPLGANVTCRGSLVASQS